MLADIAFVADNAIRCGERSRGVTEMPAQIDETTQHGDRDAELAQRAARRIGEYLTMHPGASPVTIQGELAGDDALIVPREAAVLLAQVLGYLATGEGVNVMPDSAELTTQQAAEFLNVSRPHLIKLLESEQIPFRAVRGESAPASWPGRLHLAKANRRCSSGLWTGRCRRSCCPSRGRSTGRSWEFPVPCGLADCS